MAKALKIGDVLRAGYVGDKSLHERVLLFIGWGFAACLGLIGLIGGVSFNEGMRTLSPDCAAFMGDGGVMPSAAAAKLPKTPSVSKVEYAFIMLLNFGIHLAYKLNY